MLIEVNHKVHAIPPEWREERLLDFLREYLGLTGSKFGCGAGLCGACTVTVDGVAQRSCSLNVQSVVGAEVKTIEGLSADSQVAHALQQAWMDIAVPQCGYCQAGQIMNAAALLEENPHPTDEEIEHAMDGNLCRCGTYNRIRSAIKDVAGRS
ncbi:MAG: (2Fe-2S)-binding protein [Parvibaculaceae bacterium]|nr:(2Fe-2S)-binding protein [Parvibaculaceae bacterium]